LGEISFSKDGNMLAYSISEGGSDWRKIIVMDAISKEIKEDTIIDVKFSGISWKENEGFYYSSYEKPKGSELSAKTDQHRLFYHKLETSQKNDPIIFGDTQKRRYITGNVTEDGNYLLIRASVSTSGNELYLKDLSKQNSPIVAILDNFDSETALLHNQNETLFFVTNLNAPNKRVVKVNANNPLPKNWVDVIPETNNVLSPSTAGRFIFANYMVDAVSNKTIRLQRKINSRN
jgi:prolyl oligopeptidase